MPIWWLLVGLLASAVVLFAVALAATILLGLKGLYIIVPVLAATIVWNAHRIRKTQ